LTCLGCGHVFCDTCTTHRRVVPWIDTEAAVRVCNNCNDNPKSRAPSCTSSLSETNKQLSQKSSENGSSGDSASTVSSGEHLSDLCLSPTDIFDIEQPGTGRFSYLLINKLIVCLSKVQLWLKFQQQGGFMKL